MSAGGDSAGATAEAEGSWGSGEGSTAAGSSGDSAPKPSAPVTQVLPSGPPIATLPTFEVLADGRSLVTVQVSGKTTATEQKAEGRLVYALKGVQVPARVNRMALPTQNFETRVSQVQLEQTPDGANLVIDLREPAGETQHTVSDLEGGTMLAVTIPKTVRYAAASEPKPSESAGTDERRSSRPGETDPSEEDRETEAIEGSTRSSSDRKKRGLDPDGVRFRGGISAGGGGLYLLGRGMPGATVDGRIGVQFNDLIALYAQPQLAFFYLEQDSPFGEFDSAIGVLGGTALLDFTFWDDFFLAAGGGVAVLNNPVVPAIHFRTGFYPWMEHGEDNVRRKGFLLGFDLRLLPYGGEVNVMPTVSLGYDAY